MDSTKESFHPHLSTPTESEVDLRAIILKYLAYWKWFLFSFFVFILLGFGYISTLQPLYKITANILIKDTPKNENISVLEELDIFNKSRGVENEMEIMHSYSLMEQVVDSLNLQVRYTLEKGWRSKELYGNLPIKIEIISPTPELFSRPYVLRFEGENIVLNEVTYPPNALISDSFGVIRVSTVVNDSLPLTWEYNQPLIVRFVPKAPLVASLHRGLQVNLVKNTSVVTLSMISPVPACGIDVLNKLIEVYNTASIVEKNKMAFITLKFIDQQLLSVENELDTAEQNVEQYKSQRGITEINAEALSYRRIVEKNEADLININNQLQILKQIEKYISSNSGNTAPATFGLNDQTLISLVNQLAQAEIERSELIVNNTPSKNPTLVKVNDRISKLKGLMIDNIRELRRSLESTKTILQNENRRAGTMINSMPKKERELTGHTRKKDVINQRYINLLTKRDDTAISHASSVVESRIIDSARSTPYPIKPNKKMILMMFGLLGIFFPAGIVWLINSFRTTIASKTELEILLKAPIIGEISLIKQANKMVTAYDSQSKQAEQIRTLRTNINFMSPTGSVILITSSVSSEGKTFLSANMGVALAALGKKTIVLGFDLRKQGLNKLFGIETKDGLSEYLTGLVSLDQIIWETELSDNLQIIPCGRIPPNPQELLCKPLIQVLFNQLKEEYDYIIVDTSPIGLMSDALLLDRFADITLYVVRHNYTPKYHVNLINELYHSKRLNNLGIVVNGIKDEKWKGYGYDSYRYYAKYY